MSNLTEFLLARINEDEVWAEGLSAPTARHVLAECEAKRAIVELLGLVATDPHAPGEGCNDCQTMYLLTLPYADHPDYLPEWKP